MKRTGARSAVLCAVTLFMGAGPAVSQLTGTRMDQNRGAVGSVDRLDPKSAAAAANTFAQCVARREGKWMEQALDLPFLSDEQTKAIAKRMTEFDPCLGPSRDFDVLNLSPLALPGGAAEWFDRTKYKSVDLAPLNGMTDEVADKSAFAPRTDLEDMGLCIVRRSPEHARALITTAPASDSELKAFRAMVPDIGPCVIEGTKLKLNVTNLRAVVAYALFRASSKLGATTGA